MGLCFGVVNGVEVSPCQLESFDLNFPIVWLGQMFMGTSSDEKLMKRLRARAPDVQSQITSCASEPRLARPAARILMKLFAICDLCGTNIPILTGRLIDGDPHPASPGRRDKDVQVMVESTLMPRAWLDSSEDDRVIGKLDSVVERKGRSERILSSGPP